MSSTVPVTGQKNVWIQNCDVVKTNEIIEREINGKKVNICDGVIRDSSGEIKISAFGFASRFLATAKKVEIQNCFCKLYNGEDKKEGELQISTGYFGRLKVLEKNN